MSGETEPLEVQIGELLRARQMTLAVAESCTGGLIAGRLTDVPGSSAYFVGGAIAYCDGIKQQLLGVRAETLAQHGAVSEPVARQMALGARLLFATDCALSVTGIAGPGGHTPDMPVGLTFIGLSVPGQTWVRRYTWTGNRAQNREASVQAALELILAYLRDELV